MQLSARNALVDTEVAGYEVPKGTQILTLLAAANRDPKVFADPDRLDITRTKRVRYPLAAAFIYVWVRSWHGWKPR